MSLYACTCYVKAFYVGLQFLPNFLTCYNTEINLGTNTRNLQQNSTKQTKMYRGNLIIANAAFFSFSYLCFSFHLCNYYHIT